MTRDLADERSCIGEYRARSKCDHRPIYGSARGPRGTFVASTLVMRIATVGPMVNQTHTAYADAMRLQSRDCFAEVGMLVDAKAPLVVLSREDPDAKSLLSAPLVGHFAQLGRRLAMFFRWHDHLHLRLGEVDFDVDELGAVASWSVVGARRRLEVVDGSGAVVVSLDYEIADQPVPVSDDITPFVEDEDFDFGQFVTRVLGDSERRGRMYR
jgi:hypothetical protein